MTFPLWTRLLGFPTWPFWVWALQWDDKNTNRYLLFRMKLAKAWINGLVYGPIYRKTPVLSWEHRWFPVEFPFNQTIDYISRFPRSWRYPMSCMVFWWKILEKNTWFGDPPFVETNIYTYCAEKSGNTRESFQIFRLQSRKNAGQSSWSPDHVMLRGMADELSSRYCR